MQQETRDYDNSPVTVIYSTEFGIGNIASPAARLHVENRVENVFMIRTTGVLSIGVPDASGNRQITIDDKATVEWLESKSVLMEDKIDGKESQ